ncbi:MAG: hypothetical protein M1823_003016 [Watsoniomyces obsoletus]|nr:MAG: hypothetical protein M1823_003016 [Watsoniomyces obsoletus]
MEHCIHLGDLSGDIISPAQHSSSLQSLVMASFAVSLALAVFLLVARLSTALKLQYCSNLNTGADFNQVVQKFQSNGACFETCKQSYALAIVQGNACWCSNYLPGVTTSTGDCDEKCPGFGFESCGSSSKGLFGYIPLNKAPSGTLGAESSPNGASTSSSQTVSPPHPPHSLSASLGSSAAPPSLPFPVTPFAAPVSSSSVFRWTAAAVPMSPSATASLASPWTSPDPSHVAASSLSKTPSFLSGVSLLTPLSVQSPSPSPSSVTVFATVTMSPSTLEASTVTTTLRPPSSTLTTSSRTTSSSSSTSTWTPTPVISVLTVTGGLQTITTTPTAPPRSNDLERSSRDGNGFWSSAGKVAGLFVGLALLVLTVAGAFLFVWWRRQRRRQSMMGAMQASSGRPTPLGQRSLSEFGLLSDHRTPMGEKGLTPLSTGTWARGGGAGHSPTSPLDRRNSQGRIVDQRLDPAVLWSPDLETSSRASLRSFRDDQDYSRRVLKLANPDDSTG